MTFVKRVRSAAVVVLLAGGSLGLTGLAASASASSPASWRVQPPHHAPGTSASFPPGECGPANMAAASLASSKAKVLRSAQQPAFVGFSCPETV